MISFKEMLLQEQEAPIIGKVPKNAEEDYGMELIMDLHDCDISKSNRKDIENFLEQLCKLIDIIRVYIHWWDYSGDKEGYDRDWKEHPHLVGTSVCQFISTSSIVIHTIDPFKKVFLNIFSCKTFDSKIAEDFAVKFFDGTVASSHTLIRK